MLKRQTAFVLFSFAVLAVTACASEYGRDFVRPPNESLILGKTTYKGIILKLAHPYQVFTHTVKGQPVKVVGYLYEAPRTALVGSAAPKRDMSFSFVDDILVGYGFSSSFRVDQTDFDESKVKEIKKGKTTRETVIELLGTPTGLFMYPLADDPGHKTLAYIYSKATAAQQYGKLKIHYKSIFVTIDSDDTVTDVELKDRWETR